MHWNYQDNVTYVKVFKSRNFVTDVVVLLEYYHVNVSTVGATGKLTM